MGRCSYPGQERTGSTRTGVVFPGPCIFFSVGILKQLQTWFRIPVPFRAQDYAEQRKYADDYRIVASTLLENLDFDSVIDLGCANGLLLQPFVEAGKQVHGFELSPEVRIHLPEQLENLVTIGDFSTAHGSADLACCVEMAEHIKPSRSEELVDKLCSLSEKWVFFTAAPPGQGGRGHINCRPMTDWIGWFEHRGWCLDESRTAVIRSATETLQRATWLRRNSIILRAENSK